MSKLIITSVHATGDFKEDIILREVEGLPTHIETANKRFEGVITLQYVSSGNLEGYTKGEIMEIIGRTLLNDYISL